MRDRPVAQTYLTTHKTHKIHPYPQRDSNPQSQQARDRRPSPQTVLSMRSATTNARNCHIIKWVPPEIQMRRQGQQENQDHVRDVSQRLQYWTIGLSFQVYREKANNVIVPSENKVSSVSFTTTNVARVLVLVQFIFWKCKRPLA
jgi:hypothetical protein